MRNRWLFGFVVAFVCYLVIGGLVFHYLESWEEERIRNEVFEMHRNVDNMTQNLTRGNESACLIPPPSAEPPNTDLTIDREGECAVEGGPCVAASSLPEMMKKVKNRLDEEVANLIAGKDCVPEDDIPVMIMSRRQFKYYISEARLASEHGLDPMSTENDSSPPQWSFSAAVGFSLTVVTTIGYGHIAPSTAGGMAFCVTYALIGIPLYLVILDGVGKLLGKLVRRVAKKAHSARKWSVNRVKQLAWAITFAIGLCLFFLLPAFVVSSAESWTYPESLYYMFISLSTIGFGDYVAGRQKGQQYLGAYKALMFVWIACGLVFLAMLFDLMKRGIERIDTEESKIDTQSDGGSCELQGMGTVTASVNRMSQKKQTSLAVNGSVREDTHPNV